ncbi:MAG: hypothetical protein U5J63_04145 [Fodinibius sp.]|nr:hypothetical protein [Fodinibius sp.]
MTARKLYLTKVAFAIILSLIGILLLIIPASASPMADERDHIQEEPYRVENFDITTPGKLDVRTSGGHITVKGSSGKHCSR